METSFLPTAPPPPPRWLSETCPVLHAVPGAAETSNGKRKIRNEKQDRLQMAVKKKKKLRRGHKSGAVLEMSTFQIACFSSMKMTKQLLDSVPFPSPSDNPLHSLLIVPSLLRPPFLLRDTRAWRKKTKQKKLSALVPVISASTPSRGRT